MLVMLFVLFCTGFLIILFSLFSDIRMLHEARSRITEAAQSLCLIDREVFAATGDLCFYCDNEVFKEEPRSATQKACERSYKNFCFFLEQDILLTESLYSYDIVLFDMTNLYKEEVYGYTLIGKAETEEMEASMLRIEVGVHLNGSIFKDRPVKICVAVMLEEAAM